MATYYVNITNAYDGTIGTGAIATPWSYAQWIASAGSEANDDVFRIYGLRTIGADVTPNFNHTGLTFSGWDGTVADGTAPWIVDNTAFDLLLNSMGDDECSIKELIYNHNSLFTTLSNTEIKYYKTSYFYNATSITMSIQTGSGAASVYFYGCTINTPTLNLNYVGSVYCIYYFKDCVFNNVDLDGDPQNYYITFVDCYFIGKTYSQTILNLTTNYENLTFTNCFFNVPINTTFPAAITYANAATDLEYTDYGLPNVFDSSQFADWTDDDYETGLYGNDRNGYGAFEFASYNAQLTCLRYAIEPVQGQGWTECSGNDWSFPLPNYGVMSIIDNNGMLRNVIADRDDGYLYEEGTVDRNTYARYPARDKETGTTGTEIAWEWHEGGIDLLPMADKEIEHFESHYFIEPLYPEDIGDTGYDEFGYRDDQQIDLEVYSGGNVDTVSAVTEDIPHNGDVVFSGYKIEDEQLQFVLKGAAGEVVIKGNRHDFLTKPKSGTRTERTMKDHTNEVTLSTPVFWMVRSGRYNALREQVSLTTLTATGAEIDGADGRVNSGYNLTANLTLTNAAVVGAYTVCLFASAAVTIPLAGALTQYGATFNTTWGLYYVTGANLVANIVITTGDIFDVRIYNATLTAAIFDDLYRDVRYNYGRSLLPRY